MRHHAPIGFVAKWQLTGASYRRVIDQARLAEPGGGEDAKWFSTAGCHAKRFGIADLDVIDCLEAGGRERGLRL